MCPSVATLLVFVGRRAVGLDVSAAENRELNLGTAGASARREHERRRADRHQRVNHKHPRIGKVLLALSDEPQHETAWARGAGGEERVAKALAKHLTDAVVVLHDRRIPKSRANIDHLAVTPTGVWVIDAKRYKGRVSVSKPLFGAAKLTIGGREKSKLIDGLARQCELIEHALRETSPGVAVHGALCFVDAELPLLGTLTFKGYPLLYPKALAKRLNQAGPIAAPQREQLLAQLALRFPPA